MRGPKTFRKEALLQITADSQLHEDTGSGSLGCDWIQQTFIECLWVEPTLATDNLDVPPPYMHHLSSPLSNSNDGGVILFHRKGKGNRDFCGDPGNYATVNPTPTIVNLISFLNYYLGAKRLALNKDMDVLQGLTCRGKPDLPCGGHGSRPTFL